MPISYQDAYDATNPDKTDEQRKQSALAIVAGTAANEAYWNSRSELEALKAQADGHGVVVRNEGENPTTVGGGQTATGGTIEGTATEEPSTGTGTQSGSAPAALPSPDNPTAAVAKLRAQLEAAGMTPEA